MDKDGALQLRHLLSIFCTHTHTQSLIAKLLHPPMNTGKQTHTTKPQNIFVFKPINMHPTGESTAFSGASPKTQLIIAQEALCRLSERYTCSKHAWLSICWILFSHYEQYTSGSKSR